MKTTQLIVVATLLASGALFATASTGCSSTSATNDAGPSGGSIPVTDSSIPDASDQDSTTNACTNGVTYDNSRIPGWPNVPTVQ